MLVQKIVGPKKFVLKKFWLKKNLVPQNFSSINIWSKNILLQKVLVQKSFGPRKNFGPKKFFGEKHCSTKIKGHKFFSRLMATNSHANARAKIGDGRNFPNYAMPLVSINVTNGSIVQHMGNGNQLLQHQRLCQKVGSFDFPKDVPGL